MKRFKISKKINKEFNKKFNEKFNKKINKKIYYKTNRYTKIIQLIYIDNFEQNEFF